MKDLKWDVPSTDEIEVDDETLAELERRSNNARTGRSYSIEEVRRMIPEWISKYESQKTR